jgi:hypothetical protein
LITNSPIAESIIFLLLLTFPVSFIISSVVKNVPREILPLLIIASSSVSGFSIFSDNLFARQSVGITSKPALGKIVMPALLAASLFFHANSIASISPVISM